jgi:predicted acetyltransferase
MSTEIRPPAGDDEVAAWFATEAMGFGGAVDPAFVEAERTVLPPERMVAVWEDGGPIASAGWYPFQLTLPGGSRTPVAGVCDIAVLPSHRRRGHLTRMMRHLHDEARARGELAAALTASDGSIYGRFGYGIATTHLVWELQTAHAELLDPPNLDLVPETLLGVEAAAPLTELWERTATQRAGTLSRTEAWWRLVVGPLDHWKGGGTVFTLLLRDHDGLVRGAVPYRFVHEVDRGVQAAMVQPLDLVADSPEVEAHLWVELARLDHVARIAPRLRPVDDPLRWRLVDPRRMQVGAMVDLLWLCPLDVAGLLAARSYAASATVVLAVEDTFDPEVDGTYRLEASPEGATCLRVDGAVDPDLRLSSSALGSVVLGGTSLSTLALAGRVAELQAGALATADAAFVTAAAPFNSTFF